jgi:hypothetical protein
MSTTTAMPVSQATAAGIRFTVASRPQRRFAAVQTVNNLAGGGSFNPIPLPATGFVRKISLVFTASVTSASAGAIGTNVDSPYNLITGVTLTDATGQPVMQPISGTSLYLVNKYLSAGNETEWPNSNFYADPQMGPEYAYASTATVGTAKFRLDIDFEQDAKTGYMSIPNLDSNASLQLKIDYAQSTAAFTGTGTSAATISVRVAQYYWAPVGLTTGGQPNATHPLGFGDYLETRYETQTATASSENLLNINNRGGLIKGIIAVSRAAGVRTAFTAGSNVGLVYDNNAIDEGIPLEEHYDVLRRMYGYLGADITAAMAPLSAGILPGIDVGVMVWPFAFYGPGRDTWLNTRVGTQLQVKLTPGVAATQMEFITQIAQVKDAAAFYIEA